MRLYFPVDLTGNLIKIEKLVLGEIWTGDLTIFNPDTLTSASSRQAYTFRWAQFQYILYFYISFIDLVNPMNLSREYLLLKWHTLTPIGSNSTQENSPRNSPNFAGAFGLACTQQTTAACMYRFFHILRRPGEPAVWFMSESGAAGSEQARTYVGPPIISSGFETAASVRGL